MLLCVVFPLCAAPGLILMFGRDSFSGGKMGYAARRGAIPGSRVESQACWLARMCKGCSLLSDVSCSGISRGRLSRFFTTWFVAGKREGVDEVAT